MKRIVSTIFFLTLVVFATLVQPAHAQQIAGQSANLEVTQVKPLSLSTVNNEDMEIKRRVIKAVLQKEKYNSPLADNADDFIQACTTYELNCYLLPAIAGVESTFGKAILPGSYNPFGWAGGYYMFTSWSEAIETVGSKLRSNYINKWNAKTVEEIAPIYSESPTWPTKVKYFMEEFEREEKEYRLQSQLHNVQL
jgi:hypothetical protein